MHSKRQEAWLDIWCSRSVHSFASPQEDATMMLPITRRWGVVTVVAFVAAAAATVQAQTFGEITGEVRDASGGAVSGTVVTATNRATGSSRTAFTNYAGNYTLPSLPPG